MLFRYFSIVLVATKLLLNLVNCPAFGGLTSFGAYTCALNYPIFSACICAERSESAKGGAGKLCRHSLLILWLLCKCIVCRFVKVFTLLSLINKLSLKSNSVIFKFFNVSSFTLLGYLKSNIFKFGRLFKQVPIILVVLANLNTFSFIKRATLQSVIISLPSPSLRGIRYAQRICMRFKLSHKKRMHMR